MQTLLAAQTLRLPCCQSRMLCVTAVHVRGMLSRQMVRKSYPQSHTSLMDDVLVLFVCEYPEHARSVLEPVRTLLPLARRRIGPCCLVLPASANRRGHSVLLFRAVKPQANASSMTAIM
jgi:hypothetical protein